MVQRQDILAEVLVALDALVEKRAVLPVLNRFQSRFWNREYEIGTKGPLL